MRYRQEDNILILQLGNHHMIDKLAIEVPDTNTLSHTDHHVPYKQMMLTTHAPNFAHALECLVRLCNLALGHVLQAL